jgi:hypothetical protein
MDDRLAAERELLSNLSLPELEALAAESQALMDRALAMARPQGVTPAGERYRPARPLTRTASANPRRNPPAPTSTDTSRRSRLALVDTTVAIANGN